LRVEGFAYDSAPSYVQTAQMYRCFNGGSSGSDDHFDATNPSCGPGFTAEGGQGYILTSDMTGQSTTNTMGGGSKSVKKTYCIMADPVNCATGEFYETVHDFSIPGRGLPLQLARTYSSLNAAQDGPLGHGWTDDYNMSLATDASGAMTITEETGSSVTFTPDGSGRYQAPSRVLATLVANADETYTFARQDQQKFTFTAPTTTTVGQLVKETDRNGYATTLGYANGELATVTDSAGRTLTFSYNGDGRIATIVDPIGRTVAFTYSTAGDLTYATDAGGARHITPTTRRGRTGSHRDRPQGRRRHQRLRRGRPRDGANRRDGSNDKLHVYRQCRRLPNDHDHRSTGRRHGRAVHEQRVTLADQGLDVPAGDLDVHLRPGHARRRVDDRPQRAHRLQHVRQPGNLLSHTDALSRTTSYAYDALNDTTAITDPLGVTTAMTYDVNGNLLQTERPLTQTGQTALTTLAYDPAHPGDGLLRRTPTGTRRAMPTTPTAICQHERSRRRHDSYGYDLIGRKTSRVDPRGAAPGANPISYTTTMTYNAFGQTAITDPLGRVTADQYDANQNLITTTDPLSHQTVYGYDGNNHRTSTTPDGTTLSTGYDPAGNVVTRTDALGHSTITSYDALNHASITDPLNRVTTNAYDPAGNIITMTDPGARRSTATTPPMSGPASNTPTVASLDRVRPRRAHCRPDRPARPHHNRYVRLARPPDERHRPRSRAPPSTRTTSRATASRWPTP
jgi:YD repeat-containing protein